jgi:hypothetical protein
MLDWYSCYVCGETFLEDYIHSCIKCGRLICEKCVPYGTVLSDDTGEWESCPFCDNIIKKCHYCHMKYIKEEDT